MVVVDAGIHAREWAAPISALYIMKQLIETATNIVNRFTFFIIPSLNPDGYEYSHIRDRFWRKTRSKTGSKQCRGVDPNRNFDSHFAGTYSL